MFLPSGAGWGLRLKVKNNNKRNTHSLRECQKRCAFLLRPPGIKGRGKQPPAYALLINKKPPE